MTDPNFPATPAARQPVVGEGLLAELKARIAEGGPLTIEAFMTACLNARGGYYRERDPIGAGGDFITAPEISQTFGELIGLWAAAVWDAAGRGPVRLIELGPGRGTLMADALRAARAVPGFSQAIDLRLVEISPVLRRRQAEALAPFARPQWSERLEDIPDGPAILIANEFLDALPIRQLVRRKGLWRERGVGLDARGELAFTVGEPVEWPKDYPPFPDPNAAEGGVVEINPGAASLAAELGRRARRLKDSGPGRRGPFAALFIDYGYVARAAGDSLQAVARHRYADPLATPGAADLTAHVDFAAFGACAAAAGLRVQGPMPQGRFLLELGLGARAERLTRCAAPEQRESALSGIRRLIDPQQMGVLFKVMALSDPGAPPPPPSAKGGG